MMRGKGLDQDGFIEREGGLERVPEEFAPVAAAAKTAILAAFGCGRRFARGHVSRAPCR
jgi:hypothetical protein